jgi:NitT/TauT family transport system substrate-binding protein
MKARFLALIVAVLMVGSMATGCGTPAAGPADKTQEQVSTSAVSEQPAQTQETKAQELEKLTFRLNYIATGLHAPYYVALEKGYYKEVGLDVTIAEGTGSGTTAKLVGMGTDLIGQSDVASVAAAVTQGIPIRVVCPIYKINGFSIITLEENKISTPKDLEGRKVGITTGDGPSKLWQGVVKANNLDESKVNYVTMGGEAKVGALVSGQVDAILAGADNDAIQVKEMGKNVKVLRFAEVGVPTVGLSLIASNNAIKSNTETIRKFISASLKGWDDARKDPDGAITIMKKYIPALEVNVARGGLDAAIGSLFTDSSKTISDVSKEEWETSIQLLRDYMGLDDSFPADTFYTTECMPTELPAK